MKHTTVGIDIGGTSAKLGVLDKHLAVRELPAVPTGLDITPEALALGVRDRILPAIRDARAMGEEITAVGVGSAGLVDVTAGLVRTSPNLPTWRDAPLQRLFSHALALPVVLINDADAFAYAEGKHGAGAGHRAGLFVTLGTGVGGGIMVDGRLFGGAHGVAGEIGHMSVDVQGEPCPCGGRGCLESFVGSAKIADRAERKIASGAPGTAIREAAGDGPITAAAISEAARAGDWTARAVYAEIAEILGTALAGVANLLSLDVIVIGGGVADAGDALWGPMRRTLHDRTMAPESMKPRLYASRFGALAGVVGAAAFARDQLASATPHG